MRTTDTSEAGLEALIVAHLTATAPPSNPSDASVKDKPPLYSVAGGYVAGDPRDYNRDVALDTVKLLAFLESTQHKIVEQLELGYEGIKQTQFLHRLQGEIAKRGVVDVLRKGVQHGPAHIDLYKFLPTPGNATSYENFDKNIFSITRQVRYSKDESQLALDLVLFINGLPLATFELKNRLTKQTVADAVTQYQQDREPRELLFQFGRCMAHFAVDDQEVRFCTHLAGKSSWFLPFNKGWNDGAGNPPNPNGLKTDYFWKDILARESLANIIENYAQIVEEDDEKGRKKRKQVFPRFHQLRTVRALLSWVKSAGVGRRYVESHDTAIQRKAEIMVDHFLEQVVSKRKIGGKARGMIVSAGIARACDYYKAVSDYLTELKSPFKAIVAFSGDHDFNGRKVTEADLNGFPSNKIPQMLKSDPYRFLIVANKFVTGFDEPLLHSMYVDKTLAGVQAVQALSRLNRAHPQKHDTFILDFADNAETVKFAFQDYYKATVLAGETDPNTLHDLKNELDAHQVYAWDDVEELVNRYIGGAERDQLDPILDACVATYIETLDENAQVNFKGNAKSFVRSYGFLAAILPYGHAAWEKLSIFLNFLIPKLPAPKEEDLSRGVLEAIDMDSYRPEVRAALSLAMEDKDGEVEPAPTGGGGTRPEPEIDRLSNIIKTFNEQFGNIAWKDGDKIREVIAKELPTRVAADKAYQNAIKQSDRQNARVEHDKALRRVILDLLSDHTELFKQFSDNPSFKRWLADSIFDVTYRPAIDKSGELINWWKNAATGRIKERFGGTAKWAGIVNALSEHFAARTDDPVMFTDIERIAALCEVPIEDIVTVLQVLAADDVRLVESTYSKFDETEGLLREVSPSELRTGLSGLSAPGVLGDNAISLAGNVLVGWRPLRHSEKNLRMDN